ncbi:hypothetical protein R5O24_02880 [Tenacibaculum maritimum]|uniref:hypothetical protein n=1 Tax=Tenacibaculum maritimum TaxID=107401 RepID=UPI00388E4B67
MENQTTVVQKKSQELTVKQHQLSNRIAKVGNLSELSFARKVVELVKIKELDEDELRQGLSFLFTRISNLLGIKEPITAINKTDIKEMILMRFKSLSLEEIDYAFKLERYGAYENKTEHFQLFNAEYVGAVLNKFKKWLQKTRFNNNISISKKEETKELKEEEKELIVINGVMSCFDYFKEHKQIEPGTLYVYDVLFPLGAFFFHSRKFKEKIRRKAVKSIYKKKNNVQTAIEKKQISNVLKEIREKGNPVKSKCKELVLIQFFSKIINTKQDFSTVFSELYKNKK